MMLSKCVALVTGGVQGLGRAFSERLLKEGAKVVVADINSVIGKSFEEEMNDVYSEKRLKFIPCDVSKQTELLNTFEEVKSMHGSLDIVCNNAGIMSLDPKDSRKIIDVNLTAVMEGTFKAVELMSKKHGGNGGLVVNVASAAGIDIMKGDSMYTASKHAVVAFSRAFEHLPTLAEDGVRVNCLCPFFCETELVRSMSKIYPREQMEYFQTLGLIDINDVVKAFMRCVDENEMNGNTIAIMPKDKIFDVHFPRYQPAKSN